MDTITQLLDRLASLDPTGDEALLLCAIVAALLGALIVLGFGLVQAPKRPSARTGNTRELDLMTLWRLSRLLGRARSESIMKLEPKAR